MKKRTQKAPISEVELLIPAKLGNVSAIARALNCSRAIVWKRIQSSPKLQSALEDARETMLDNAESKLYQNALNGDTTSLIFFLKTQGKSRGYTEKSEVEHSGQIDVRTLSDDELEAIATGKSGG